MQMARARGWHEVEAVGWWGIEFGYGLGWQKDEVEARRGWRGKLPEIGEYRDNAGVVRAAGLMKAELGQLPRRHPTAETANRFAPELLLTTKTGSEAQVRAMRGKVHLVRVRRAPSQNSPGFVHVDRPQGDDNSFAAFRRRPENVAKSS